jgi:hypothetical protein
LPLFEESVKQYKQQQQQQQQHYTIMMANQADVVRNGHYPDYDSDQGV